MLLNNFLQDIKIDYSYDKTEMIHALYHTKKIFDENDIKFWLDAGTLLGAIRENKIIEWDDDIDICVWNSSLSKIAEIRNIIDNSDFELYIIPIHFFPFSFGHYGLRLKKNKKHLLCIFSCFIVDYNVVWMRTLPFIGNIIRFFHFKNKNNLCSIFWKILIKFKLYKIQKLRYKKSMLGDFKQVMFYEKYFNVPSNYEDCLNMIYGDWKTPSRRK